MATDGGWEGQKSFEMAWIAEATPEQETLPSEFWGEAPRLL